MPASWASSASASSWPRTASTSRSLIRCNKPVLTATSDLAVVRMHGHSDKWTSKEISEKFGYKYSDQELAEWAGRVRDLGGQAEVTHVLFNNCYRDWAHVNAQQLTARLAAPSPGA